MGGASKLQLATEIKPRFSVKIKKGSFRFLFVELFALMFVKEEEKLFWCVCRCSRILRRVCKLGVMRQPIIRSFLFRVAF